VFPDEIKFQELRENDMKFRHLLAVLALFAAVDSHAALIHQYALNGSLKDQLGGPDLVANGGSLASAGVYAFKANQGLQLQEKIGAVYSIDMAFHLDALGSWRKIVDSIHIYDAALSAAEVHQLVNPSQVAEPASALLVLCGLGMLGVARRRRLV
jgi:hypothetical protein